MSDKSATFRTETLQHVFHNTAIAKIGDASGLQPSAVDGNLYLQLHTAAPVGDSQTSNEATYTGYSRAVVARDSGEWDVTDNVASNINPILWGQRTDFGTQVITHISVGTDAAGAGKILYFKALGTSLSVTQNVTPKVIAEAATFTET